MNQKIVSLGEVSKLYSGGDAPKEVSCERTKEFCYPIFSNGLEKEGLYGYAKKATMPANTITISARGTIGAVFYRNEQFLPIVRLITIEPNRSLIDSKYLYYYFKINKIEGFGTSQQQLTIPFVRKRKLLIFSDINYQKRIADILFNYDHLIENNNKRINVLEQMAENLYKEWFVRFRFPGYTTADFIDSELGHIPSTFSVVKMKDVINSHIGGGWGSEEADEHYSIGAFVIRGTDFPNVKKGDLSTCPFRYHKASNYATRQLKEDDIILEVSGGTAEQPVGRAILVTEGTLKRMGNSVICASFCKLMRLNTDIISPYYFIYWMNYLYETRIIDRFQLQSTGIINFKFEYFLRKGAVLLPPVEIMNEFSSHVKTIQNQIDKLAEVNENLIKQRDMLLPRLMSGKLEVK